MARGFESKDVEFQQAEAERTSWRAPAMTADQRQRVASQQIVRLALTRARVELAATSSPVRRDTLSRAIAELEGRLAEIGSI